MARVVDARHIGRADSQSVRSVPPLLLPWPEGHTIPLGARMARKLLVLLLVAGAAYVIYDRTSHPPSEEDALVASVKDRYALAVNKFLAAAGRAGAIGLDTTFDSESAAAEVLRLRSELAELRKTLTEERAIKRAEELAERIEEFCRKNDIIRP